MVVGGMSSVNDVSMLIRRAFAPRLSASASANFILRIAIVEFLWVGSFWFILMKAGEKGI